MDEWLQVKIDTETKNQLAEMAQSIDRSMSWFVRYLIRREYAREQQGAASSAEDKEPAQVAG